ncbi:hypothetical protein [Evansella tamaricis]|uniref:Uncharacterized protein n=1 Tax=Evansella tamaricis TaxID=2069301 RepID=A0ABS6JA58_9BACI|nr:hypothetical protein [Evansella tamaricis]MBU9710563.1 hypothetical protein [Evansella tamaricis]
MTVTKQEVLRLIHHLSEDELRLVHTFISEYREAVNEEKRLKEEKQKEYISFHVSSQRNPYRRKRNK